MKRDTFIVPFVKWLVGQAKKVSFFYWVEKSFGSVGFFFIDAWAFSFLASSFVAYCLSLCINSIVFQIAVVVFSAIRVFEYLVYLLWVILFAKPNKGKTDLRSYRRTLLLMMSNYLETIFWFATWLSVMTWLGSIEIIQGPRFFALLRESVMLMVANWSGNLVIKSDLGVGVVTVQDLIGLFMTIVVGARIISLLPRPTSADPDENRKNG